MPRRQTRKDLDPFHHSTNVAPACGRASPPARFFSPTPATFPSNVILRAALVICESHCQGSAATRLQGYLFSCFLRC